MAIDPQQSSTADQSSSDLPPGPRPLMFEQFQGINTSTTRPGVKDEEMAWCDGFIPLGPMSLRILPDVGPKLWSHPESGTSISFFDFANIGAIPYAIVFSVDGDIWAVNTTTGVATLIAPDATIQNPTRISVGLTQWGSQYIIIVSQQTNGYFIWDGTLFYAAGTLAPGVTITNGGTGYTTPSVTVTGGAGTGASFTATVVGGVITAITMTNPGNGYNAGDVVTVVITGTHTVQATATVTLMPFAVSGTAVTPYSGHVWVANGPTIFFSAPGSVSNFTTANGGGNFTSSDSYLRVKFVQLLSTNGFLYLIADSSVNYISGVQTSGTPTTTTFTNQNADPEVGTPYPATVDVFGRNILFANSFGAHVSYGAAVTKVSEALDGIFNTVPNFAGFTLCAAKAIIFGKKVWMMLVPIIDPVTGLQVNKLLMWNGKLWWASGQSINLLYIQHQEIDSVLTAWGTDGLSLYPLFQEPSNAFKKTVQSKLWSVGGYFLQKAGVRLWGLAQYFDTATPALICSVDNEFGLSSQTVQFLPTFMIWHTVGGAVMNWTTTGGAPMTWFVSGISAFTPEPVGQQGALLGVTLVTNADDAILISLALQPEVVAYRG